MLNLILLLICFISSTIFIYVRQKGPSPFSLILKTMASAFLLMTSTIMMFRNPTSNFSLFITLGMLMGMLGDIYLALKGIYVNNKKCYLYAGVLFFLFGHIFYFCANLVSIISITDEYLYILISIIAITLLVIMLLRIVFKKIFKDINKEMYIILLYCFVITYTLLTSIYSLVINNNTWLFFVGMLLFSFSDLILAFIYFGSKKDDKMFCLINHITYYLAQISIVFSILFVL